MNDDRKNPCKKLMVAVCLGLLASLTACSYQSVRHLERQPWTVGAERNLSMNYLTFTYATSLNDEGIRIQGTAYPRPAAIPEWAVWAHDIWLATYLCKDTGQVVAKKIDVLPPQELDAAKGIGFDFLLEPQVMAGAGPVFVTFGYRLVLSADMTLLPEDLEKAPGKDSDVFFASESALTRF